MICFSRAVCGSSNCLFLRACSTPPTVPHRPPQRPIFSDAVTVTLRRRRYRAQLCTSQSPSTRKMAAILRRTVGQVVARQSQAARRRISTLQEYKIQDGIKIFQARFLTETLLFLVRQPRGSTCRCAPLSLPGHSAQKRSNVPSLPTSLLASGDAAALGVPAAT